MYILNRVTYLASQRSSLCPIDLNDAQKDWFPGTWLWPVWLCPPADDLKLYLTAPTQHCLPSVSMGMVRNTLLVGCLRKPLLAKLFRFMFLQQSKKLIFPRKAENGPIIFKASSSYFLSQGWPLKLDHIEEDLFSLCTSYWLVYFYFIFIGKVHAHHCVSRIYLLLQTKTVTAHTLYNVCGTAGLYCCFSSECWRQPHRILISRYSVSLPMVTVVSSFLLSTPHIIRLRK